MAGPETTDPAGRNASARDRLENLKARRAAGSGPQALIAGATAKRTKKTKPHAEAAGAERPMRGRKKMGGGGGGGGKGGLTSRIQSALSGPEGADKRQWMLRAVRILLDTSDEDSGVVAGTPFTYAGVKKLVDLLEARSKDKEGKGANMAAKVLLALSKGDGDGRDSTIHGIQLRRLEQLSKLGERLKGRLLKKQG